MSSLFAVFVRALVLLACSLPLVAQQTINRWDYQQGQITLELTGVFDPPPLAGVQPIRVSARNVTTMPQAWNLEFKYTEGFYHSGKFSRFAIEAEAQQEKSVMWLVPVASNQHGGQSLEVKVNSATLGSEFASVYSNSDRAMPRIAISDALARNSLTQLNDEVKKQCKHSYRATFGSRYRPEQLPEEWLGFSGFDCVMITASEWLGLSAGVRAALRQWVELGGRLDIYAPDGNMTLASLGLKGNKAQAPVPSDEDPSRTASDPKFQLGLGGVELRSWDDHTLAAESTVKFYLEEFRHTWSRLADRLRGRYKNSWNREAALGERNFAGWQVLVILVVFGLLVGPVNLFLLAPPGRRHRLFFTTPVISLGTSALIVALIFLQDGTGGEGRRFAAVYLAPGEAAAAVTQEQISRTGVLLSSHFTLPPETQCEAIRPSNSPWEKLFRSGDGLQAVYQGNTVSGNWFQSRAVQAQFLRSRVPGRGRIDWLPAETPNGAPSIVSSLDFTLQSFVCRDHQGKAWAAPAVVEQGRKVTLVPISQEGFKASREEAASEASSYLAKQIFAATEADGCFIASATEAPSYFVETLKSLKWKDDRMAVLGPLPATP